MEQELKERFDQEEQEEEELDNDPRMKIEGNINFPDELPGRKDDEPKALEIEEPDDDEYMQELMNQQKDQQRDREPEVDEEPELPDSETDSAKARRQQLEEQE